MSQVKEKRDKGFWLRVVSYIASAGLLVAIIVPQFVKARTHLSPYENTCFLNQQQFLVACEAYRERHHLKPNAAIQVSNLVNESFLERMPTCPDSGPYGATLTEHGMLNCAHLHHGIVEFTNDLAARGLYLRFEKLLNHPPPAK
ncbi:MAG: hypothetical protein WCO56_18030 [Verrucomicrobiota bacterium]